MSLKVRVIHSGAFNRLARLGKENHPSWEYDVTEHPKNPLHWVINDGSGVTIPKEDCQVIEEKKMVKVKLIHTVTLGMKEGDILDVYESPENTDYWHHEPSGWDLSKTLCKIIEPEEEKMEKPTYKFSYPTENFYLESHDGYTWFCKAEGRIYRGNPRDGFKAGPFVEGEKESDPEKEADAFEKMSVSEQRSAHKKFLRDIEKRENEKNKSWAKEQEEKTINSIKKQIQDEFERIDKNILESFRKEKLGEPYTSQGFINLIKAQGDVSLSDAVKNINNQTLVVIPPTEKEVMNWINMHDENIGYDHNTKLAIFAFYYWMKGGNR